MTMQPADWSLVRRTVRRAVRSSLHCSIASSNPDGTAHVTPIGSVVLTGVDRGIYFDVFNRQLSRNVDREPTVTILALDSSRPMWLRSLLGGRMVRPAGYRLLAEVGPRRPATTGEVARLHRFLGPLRHTRGGRILWGRLPAVRDLRIHAVDTLRLGALTHDQQAVAAE